MAIVTWSSLRKQGEKKDHWVRRHVRGGSAWTGWWCHAAGHWG